MKRRIFLTALVLIFGVCLGCGKTRIVHCDHCGKELTVSESSNVTEEWVLYCEDCQKELFGDDPIVKPG